MAEKKTIDVSEFEKRRDELLKDEDGREWKVAKEFEYTTVYRRVDNDSVFKVNDNALFLIKSYYAFFYSSSAKWLVFPKKIVSCVCACDCNEPLCKPIPRGGAYRFIVMNAP